MIKKLIFVLLFILASLYQERKEECTSTSDNPFYIDYSCAPFVKEK